jgi:hypothetical protein
MRETVYGEEQPHSTHENPRPIVSNRSRGWMSLHHWPHFRTFVESPVTEHAFPSIKILTTNGTGDRVVVGFLVAFLSIGTAKIITFYPNIAYVSIVSFQKYVCDKCGKQFTEKRSLTRHMKTHVDFY